MDSGKRGSGMGDTPAGDEGYAWWAICRGWSGDGKWNGVRDGVVWTWGVWRVGGTGCVLNVYVYLQAMCKKVNTFYVRTANRGIENGFLFTTLN
jgi:hypothetical protein